MQILLVDDVAIVLQTFRENLERPGVKIDSAQTCCKARQLLKENSYDWVTLDLRLPDGNGIDILKEIRAKYPNTRVVVISMDADNPLLREKLLSLEAEAVFPKPFDMRALVKLIYGPV